MCLMYTGQKHLLGERRDENFPACPYYGIQAFLSLEFNIHSLSVEDQKTIVAF